MAWGSQRSHLSHNPENDYEIFTGQPICTHSCTVNIETENDKIDRTPAWAPQPVMGYDIAYSAYPGPFGSETPTIALLGQGQPLLLTEGQNPNFSGNADWVVYQLDGSIYKIEVGLSTTPVRLTNGTGDGAPHWSWVNNKIVYETLTPTYGRDIYVMEADGSNQRLLVPHSMNEHTPTWSPDGKKVVFMSNRDFNFDIYVYEVE
jgi:Tol biopolymer transport system component